MLMEPVNAVSTGEIMSCRYNGPHPAHDDCPGARHNCIKAEQQYAACYPGCFRHRTVPQIYAGAYRRHVNGADLEQLLNLTDGYCMMCLSAHASVIEHCHYTDMVRGVVCGRCNGRAFAIDWGSDILNRASEPNYTYAYFDRTHDVYRSDLSTAELFHRLVNAYEVELGMV